jgi:hypothetical protein
MCISPSEPKVNSSDLINFQRANGYMLGITERLDLSIA